MLWRSGGPFRDHELVWAVRRTCALSCGGEWLESVMAHLLTAGAEVPLVARAHGTGCTNRHPPPPLRRTV